MKKLIFSVLTVFMLFSAIPVQMHASTEAPALPPATSNTNATAETTAMMARLYEIRAMDISSLGSAEKKQLRKEVRAIKSDMKAANEGVYLSVGAIIIIILLLILIL